MSNFLSTTQPGMLTSTSLQAASFGQINADFYVDGTYGFDGNPGTSPGLAFRTFLPLTYQLPLWRKNNNYSQQIVVAFSGVVNQEWNAPIVNDVRIVGAAGQPRQATTSSVPNGGGATWLSPTGGTGSLLTVNGQGWVVENIYFNSSATGATTACLVLTGGGDPPVTADAAHARIAGCVFTGEANGVYFNGGPGFVTIEHNRFQNFDTSGDKAILTAAGVGGTGAYARILNNVFDANLTHISGLAKANSWEIAGNRFSYISTGVTTTLQIDLTGGANNSVHNNYFDLPYSTNGISAMFVLGTADRWYFNEFATAVTTTIFSFGAPAS